jgi:hypothetical protein
MYQVDLSTLIRNLSGTPSLLSTTWFVAFPHESGGLPFQSSSALLNNRMLRMRSFPSISVRSSIQITGTPYRASVATRTFNERELCHVPD